MVVMDFFIVNVAFPSVQTSLHAGAGAIEWVVAGYGLTFAGLLITSGRAGDRFGRRRLFTLGVALFVLSSIACAGAPDATFLVAARLLQGGAAALISSNVLSIIGVVFTGADRVRAISVYGMTLGVAAAGGQLIGGALIAWNPFDLGWRTIFLVNVPVGMATLRRARQLIPESRAKHPARLDLIGMALVTAGVTAVVLPLIEGPQLNWPGWTWLSVGLALPILVVFVVYEGRLMRRGGAPLIDPVLFLRRSFSAGLATQLCLWCSVASFFLVLALYLQRGRGMSPLQSGAVFTILAGAFVLASLRAPAMLMRIGGSLVTIGGLALGAGFAVMLVVVHEIGVDGSIWWLAPGLALIGAGQGFTMTPLTMTVLSHAEPERAGTVSGVLGTTQQVDNALGVAVTGAIFFSAAHAGYAQAFTAGLIELICLLGLMIAASRLVPRRASAQVGASKPGVVVNAKEL